MANNDLRVFRATIGHNQEQMASNMHCTVSAVSLIERGKRAGGVKFWKRLQEVYGLDDATAWRIMTGTKYSAKDGGQHEETERRGVFEG